MAKVDPSEAPEIDFGPDPDRDQKPDFDTEAGPDLDRAAATGRRFSRRGASRLQALQSLPLRLALGGAVVFVVGLLVTAGA
jgi:hypothetical protein